MAWNAGTTRHMTVDLPEVDLCKRRRRNSELRKHGAITRVKFRVLTLGGERDLFWERSSRTVFNKVVGAGLGYPMEYRGGLSYACD